MQIRTAKATHAGSGAPLPAFEHDWAAGQRVAISSSNAYSAAITSSNVVNVKPTVDCYITTSPAASGGTATPASASGATSWPLLANETYTIVLPAEGWFVAAITAGASGHIYIHPAKV